MPNCIAIVVAAGRGTRFGQDGPKQYASLAGKPLIARTLAALTGHPRIDGVLPVIHPDDEKAFAEASIGLPLMPPVTGGATRQESVRLGLEALAAQAPERVLIHDGARPMVCGTLIDRVLDALEAASGAVPVLKLHDTLKRIDTDGRIEDTLPREHLARVQTPQGFHYRTILDAHRRQAGKELTDDAALLENDGVPVVTVPGDDLNIKVTTQGDLTALLDRTLETRTGSGFDVHRFGPGDHVMLGGIAIPSDRALIGHSDADVLLHAMTDAVLGVLGDGDIGVHFPPSNAAYAGAPSRDFFRFALDRLNTAHGCLRHLDATIICEFPKVGPWRDRIRASIAEIAGVDIRRISVKATTTEGLGFTGRGEGIACQALATVRLPGLAPF